MTKAVPDTLLFVRRPEQHLPSLHDWFVISYDNADTMNIQRGPSGYSQMLCQRLGKMLQERSEDDSIAVLKLKGTPWISSGEDTVKVRSMLLMTRETLDVMGGRIYASFKMNSKSEMDILVCVRNTPSESVQGSFM